MNSNPALQSSRLRRFRLLAMLLAITPFLLVEITVRLFGWGLPRESYDPYLGFESVQPLFVVNEIQDRYEVAESRLDFFRPDHFPTSKGSSTYRVFCLGGSTVQGRPYALETAFSSWLELSLQSAAPQRSWEVINCGGISYASYRLVPIMEEILSYQPDLVILYTGHNEFLEDRTYPHFKDPSLARQALYNVQSSWRTINWLRQLFYHSPLPNDAGAAPIVMPTEVNGLLDQARLQDYHRDANWHQDVVQHYEFNLQRMVQLAARAHVPLLLVNPVSNLKDCPPFKIEPGSNLNQVDRQRVQQLQDAAHSAESLAIRVEKLAAAVALDPQHAGIQYQLGKCYEDLEQFKKARQSFLAAKDQDVCPLRMLESMHTVLLRTASETDTPLVDARKLLESRSSAGMPGKKVLLDHVHPTIEAHQWIAEALLETMFELEILAASGDWKAARNQRYREHLAGLSEVYYARGKQRLAGLRLWTQGRAKPRTSPP
ncbi:MAG: hypothetical protein OSB47_11110 [Pirellulaceae bacterium]|nr:hypothetical protein [Pirellulaceae bacterium]